MDKVYKKLSIHLSVFSAIILFISGCSVPYTIADSFPETFYTTRDEYTVDTIYLPVDKQYFLLTQSIFRFDSVADVDYRPYANIAHQTRYCGELLKDTYILSRQYLHEEDSRYHYKIASYKYATLQYASIYVPDKERPIDIIAFNQDSGIVSCYYTAFHDSLIGRKFVNYMPMISLICLEKLKSETILVNDQTSSLYEDKILFCILPRKDSISFKSSYMNVTIPNLNY